MNVVVNTSLNLPSEQAYRIAELEQLVDQQQRTIDYLQKKFHYALEYQFGCRSEQIHSNQFDRFAPTKLLGVGDGPSIIRVDYSPIRASSAPETLLSEHQGYLQTNVY